MNTFAIATDTLLWALLAVTLAIIFYKGIDLYFPSLLKRPPLLARAQDTERSMAEVLEEAEREVFILDTIASAGPFIGLVGTVVHITVALQGMGKGAADLAVIGGPIATALLSTLVGLSFAIPAMVASNVFQRKIDITRARHERAKA